MSQKNSNDTMKIEEVEALSAIYGSEWKVESESSRSYSIKISEEGVEVVLSVTLPLEYPGAAPPVYELSAPWMGRKEKEKLRIALDEVYLNNIGETVIYQWVEAIREIVQSLKPSGSVSDKEQGDQNTGTSDVSTDLSELDINCSEISHSEVIVDRKSSFQGHAAEVHSLQDVKAVLKKLKQNKKIANAYHNMFAYRIELGTDKPVLLQDCDDDGENHAGGRMLHLLQILDVKNVVVVVSRWYGGIQLGPDRFRHINNATRQALLLGGFIKK